MFNHGLRGRRGGDSSGVTGLNVSYVESKTPQVTINGYFVTGQVDLALDTNGGQTIIVTGAGFSTGITGTIGGVTISAITYISPTQVSFTSPAKTGGLYVIVLTNTNGSTGALVPGILYSSVPTFNTGAGSIGTVYETTAYSKSVAATSDSSITYQIVSGSLPADATFNTSTGLITGTVPTIASGSTTYSFTVTATDLEKQSVTRSFSITESTDTLVWITPSNSATLNISGGSYSQALNATDNAGYGVSYTADVLPTGLTLSGGTISGTPTVAGTVSTQLTATAAVTTRSQINNITWVISLGDTFWGSTTMLLSGTTPTTTFINDASLNNSQLTIAGDTKPTTFTPYIGDGYYSNYFNGTSSQWISFPAGAGTSGDLGSGDFTLECWTYLISRANLYPTIFDNAGALGNTNRLCLWAGHNSVVTTNYNGYLAGSNMSFSTAIIYNAWVHLALVRSGTTIKLYVNGVADATTYTSSVNLFGITTAYVGGSAGDAANCSLNGLLSNFRMVKGTAVYTSNFTPSTTPLSAIANTTLLTCQSNRFIDKSLVSTIISTSGTPTIMSAIPFTQPTSVTVNTGTSVYFNGSTDYFSLSSATALNIGSTTACCFEMWVYPSTVTNASNIQIFQSGSGNLAFLILNGGAIQPGKYGFAGFAQTTATISANVWTHLAVTGDGANNWRTFINGVLQGYQSYSIAPNNSLMTIGGGSATNAYFTGFMSNFRVTVGGIPSAYVTASTTIGTTVFTPSTTPLTAITNTQLLTLQGTMVTDASTNAYTLTPSGTPKVLNNTYPFTQTTSTVSNLNVLGSTYFDGAGDYLSLPYSSSISLTSQNFTIEFWVYFASVAGLQSITGQYNSTSNLNWTIYTAGSGTLNYYLSSNGTTWNIASAVLITNIVAGTWYHIAFVRNGSVFTPYTNGVAGTTTTSASALFASTAPLGIGAVPTGGNLTGYISDYRFINGTAVYTSNFAPTYQPLTAITNTQLLTLQYNGGANNYGIIDNGPLNNIITRFGNATQGTFSPYSQTGWSVYYPVLAYMTYASNPITSFGVGVTFTVEAWVNVTTYSLTSVYYFNLLASCDQSSLLYWTVGIGSTGLATVMWYDGGTKTAAGSTVLNRGTWYHVAAVVTSGVVKIYVNGVAETLTGTTTLTAPTGNSSYTTGTDRGASNGSSGYISNLRTATTALYSSNFTPSTTPLTYVSTVSLLTCQSNRFIDNSANNLAITPFATTPPQVQAYSPFGGVTVTPTSYSNLFNIGNTDGYLTIADSANLRIGTSQFTIEAWIYLTAWISGAGHIIQKRAYNSTGTGTWDFWAETDGSIRFAELQTPTTLIITAASTIVINTWYHVAVTRDSSNILKLFVNGVSVGTTAPTSTLNFNDSTNSIFIGRNNDASAWKFNGYISNVRMVIGTAVYTNTFTPSTSPLTAITNTQLLTCQSTTVKDNSSNNYSITQTGTTTFQVSKYNPFGYTAQSATVYTPSIHGGSAYFDGSGDYLDSQTSSVFTYGTGDFTIEFWAYLTTISASTPNLIDQRNGSHPSVNPTIFMNAGTLTYYTNGLARISGPTLSANTWYHIALCRGSATTRMFINGTQVGSSYADTNSYISTKVRVFADDNGATTFQAGYCSDLRVIKGTALYTSNFVPPAQTLGNYSTAIPSSLLLNFNNGGIIDQHSSNVLETVGNTQLVSEDPYSGSYYSVLFSSSYLYLNNQLALGAGDFTIEFFIFFNDVTTSANIFEGRPLSTNGAYPTIYVATGTIRYFTSSADRITSSTVVTGLWYHVAVVRSSGTIKMYVNGTQAGSSYTDATTYLTGANRPIIGSFDGSTGMFSGYISNLRVISAAQYTTTFTPSTTPLTVISNTQLLTCQLNNFTDKSTNNFALSSSGAPKVKSFNPFQQNTGKSIYFNSSNSNALLFNGASIPGGAGYAFTVEFWLYAPSVASITIMRANGNGSSLGFSVNASSQLVTSNNFISDFLVATTALVSGVWTHIAVTRTTANLYSVYYNGVSAGTPVTYATSLGVMGVAQMYFSYNTYTVGYSSFYLKDFRVTNALRYTTTFTPPTSTLQIK